MFIEFGLKDFIDIFLVALMLYYIYKIMRSSGSLNIFFGVLIFIVLWIVVSQILEMRLLGSIVDKLVSVGTLALIILFQDEIRRFFYSLGAQYKASRIFNLFKGSGSSQEQREVMPIVLACKNMGELREGALIVLERQIPLDDIVNTGDKIDSKINQLLIQSIFFKNSPLHDGAMVISNGRIKAARCTLPVSHNLNIPKELGLRHRAAMGISQETDAMAVIVSEETGAISVADHGEFKLRLSAEELERLLAAEIITPT